MNTNAPLLVPLLAALASAAWGATLDEGLALKRDHQLPGAEAVFSTLIAADPADDRALAERATVRGWQEKYDAAIADWRAALALKPQAASYHVGLARVLGWKGERAAALAELDKALLTAPRDAEVWELKGDIARADGNRALALTAYREADRLDPRDRVVERLGREDLPPATWRIDVGGMRDHYSAVRDLESSGYASVGYAHRPGQDGGPDWTARLGSVVERRFGATDVGVDAEGTWKLTDTLRVAGRGGYTPAADFLPDWKAGGGFSFRPVDRAALLLDIDHSEYRDSDNQVLQVAPGLEVGIWRLSVEVRYRATIDHVPGATDKGDSVLGRISGDFWGVRPSIAYVQGREPDPPFPVANVKAVWGSLEFPIDRRLSLRADAAFEHREDTAGGTLYNRISLGGGLILRY